MPRLQRKSEPLLEICEAELIFKASSRLSKSIIESLSPELGKDRGEISTTKDGFRITLKHTEVGRLRAMVGAYIRLVNSAMKVLQREQ